jgi:hypothetical protein
VKPARCSLSGVVVDGGRSSIAMRSAHARCRIPIPQWGAAAVPTERGWLRPERSLCYSSDVLLLHDVACSRPGETIPLADLCGYEKTARRLLALAATQRWSQIEPLQWICPETIAFTTGDDIRFYQGITTRGALEQAETLERCAEGADHYLTFQRC